MSAPEGKIPEHWLASKKTQAVLFVLTVLYCLSPIDLIPDVMPVIGWLDDAGVALADIIAFIYYLHQKRKEHEAKRQS